MKSYKSIVQYLDFGLLRGAGIVFIIKVCGAGASLGLQLLLARLLNLNAYGKYVYIIAWVNIISTFTTLGFTTSLIRFIPEYLRNKDYGKLKGVIKVGIISTFFGSFLVTIIGLLFIFVLSYKSSQLFKNHQYLVFSFFIVMPFMKLFSSIEMGKKRMFAAYAPTLFFKHIFIGFGILILWKKQILNLQTVLIVTLISFIIVNIWYLGVIRKGFPKQIFYEKTVYRINKWIKTSLPLLFISGFMIILNRIDLVMLGMLSTKSQVGIYNVAYKIAIVVNFIFVAVNAIAGPMISELYHQGKMQELQKLAHKIAHLIFWPTLVLSLGLILGADYVLGLFGKEFIGGQKILLILIIGQLVNALVGSVSYYLNMTGYEKDSAKVYGVAAFLNIILNPLGIYLWGAVGAALMTTLTTILWNIWLYFLVKEKVGIRSSIF